MTALPFHPLQFSQVLFSLQLFLLSPFVRRYIRATSVAAHVATTVCMVAAAAAILDPLSRPAALMFVVVVLAIALVCPALLVSIHKYKAKISGPWDEAVPAIPQHLHLG
jgi:phosphatidylinositol glycan class C protein